MWKFFEKTKNRNFSKNHQNGVFHTKTGAITHMFSLLASYYCSIQHKRSDFSLNFTKNREICTKLPCLGIYKQTHLYMGPPPLINPKFGEISPFNQKSWWKIFEKNKKSKIFRKSPKIGDFSKISEKSPIFTQKQ